MTVRCIAVFLAAVLCGQACALGTIRIESDVPAYVELKGEKLGEAPLLLHDLRRGTYELVITAFATGETKTYRVSIPGKTPVTRNVSARFSEGTVQAASAASEARQAARSATPSGAPAPAPAAQPAAPRRLPGSGLIHQARHRMKDRYTQRHVIAGGAALLGAATGAGILAGLGLGGVIMNEVIHREDQSAGSHVTSPGWEPIRPRR